MAERQSARMSEIKNVG